VASLITGAVWSSFAFADGAGDRVDGNTVWTLPTPMVADAVQLADAKAGRAVPAAGTAAKKIDSFRATVHSRTNSRPDTGISDRCQ